jgi:hypothetical protein
MTPYSQYSIIVSSKWLKKKSRGVADTGARVSSMANRCFWITTTPQSATRLHRHNTREGQVGCLAGLASWHLVPYTREETADNVLAVLERSNRVYQIGLDTLQFEF